MAAQTGEQTTDKAAAALGDGQNALLLSALQSAAKTTQELADLGSARISAHMYDLRQRRNAITAESIQGVKSAKVYTRT